MSDWYLRNSPWGRRRLQHGGDLALQKLDGKMGATMAVHTHARVTKQTVLVERHAAWTLLHKVDSALQIHGVTGIGGWIRSHLGMAPPRRKRSPLLENYIMNPHQFGKTVMKGLPRDVQQRLNAMKPDTSQGEPFLVLRKYLPRRRLDYHYFGKFDDQSYEASRRRPTWKEWYVEDRYYDVMVTALLSALGVHHQSKSPDGQQLFRDYFTTPCAVIDQFGADEDLPRRFRQAVPELALKDDPMGRAGKLTARFVAYACIENPVHDAIWILPAQDVIDALTDKTKDQLRNSVFEFFDNWSPDLSARETKIPQKVLGGPNDNWISFDANRFNWDYTHTKPEAHLAIGELVATLRTLSKTKAFPVVLEKGDVLIVDNYRAFIRRTEPLYKPRKPRLWGRPPIRWIRMYSGFPLDADKPQAAKKRRGLFGLFTTDDAAD